MRKALSLLSLVAAGVLVVGSANAQTWSILIPESTITTATGETAFSAGALAVNAAGDIAVIDRQTAHKVVLITGSTATLVASAASISAAIDAANGTATAPTAAQISVQAVDFNANGQIIVYTRNSGGTSATDQGTLLAIAPTPPYTISVLSTAVDTGNSPVSGGMGMTLLGNTAYIFADDFYFPNAPAEGVYSVDTSTLVNDGSKTATLVLDSATLQAATGDTAANMALNDGAALDANTIIAINSGVSGSNDNLVSLNVSGTPSASLYVQATDIAGDLSTANVGYSAIAANPAGIISLLNMFGAATEDDGVIFLNGITPPTATATIERESDIVGDLSATDMNTTGNDGIVYSAARGGILVSASGTGTRGILFFPQTSSVSDWNMMD